MKTTKTSLKENFGKIVTPKYEKDGITKSSNKPKSKSPRYHDWKGEKVKIEFNKYLDSLDTLKINKMLDDKVENKRNFGVFKKKMIATRSFSADPDHSQHCLQKSKFTPSDKGKKTVSPNILRPHTANANLQKLKTSQESVPIIDIMRVKEGVSQTDTEVNSEGKPAIAIIQSKIDAINNYLTKRTRRRKMLRTPHDPFVAPYSTIEKDFFDSIIKCVNDNIEVDDNLNKNDQVKKSEKVTRPKYPQRKGIVDNAKLGVKKGVESSETKERNKRETVVVKQHSISSIKSEVPVQNYFMDDLVSDAQIATLSKEILFKSVKNEKPGNNFAYIVFEDKEEKAKSPKIEKKVPKIEKKVHKIDKKVVSKDVHAKKDDILETNIENYVKEFEQPSDACNKENIKSLEDKIDTIEKLIFSKWGNSERVDFDALFKEDTKSRKLKRMATKIPSMIKTVTVKLLDKKVELNKNEKTSKCAEENVISNLYNKFNTLENSMAATENEEEFKDARSRSSIHESIQFDPSCQSEKLKVYYFKNLSKNYLLEDFSKDSLLSQLSVTPSSNYHQDKGKIVESFNKWDKRKQESVKHVFNLSRKHISKSETHVIGRGEGEDYAYLHTDALTNVKKADDMFSYLSVYQIKSSNVLDGYKKDNIRNFYKFDVSKRKVVGEFRKNEKKLSALYSGKTKNDSLISSDNFQIQKAARALEIKTTPTPKNPFRKVCVSVSTNTTSNKEVQFPEKLQEATDEPKPQNEAEEIKRAQLKMQLYEKSKCLEEIKSQINQIRSSLPPLSAANYFHANPELAPLTIPKPQELPSLVNFSSILQDAFKAIPATLNIDTNSFKQDDTISEISDSVNVTNIELDLSNSYTKSYKNLQRLASKITTNTMNFEKEIEKCKRVLTSLQGSSNSDVETVNLKSFSAPISSKKSEFSIRYNTRPKGSKYRIHNKHYRKISVDSKVNVIAKVIKNIQEKMDKHEKNCLSCNTQALNEIHNKIDLLKTSRGATSCRSDVFNTLHETVNILDSDLSTTTVQKGVQHKVECLDKLLNCDFTSIIAKIEMFDKMCSSMTSETNVIKQLQDKIEKLEAALNNQKMQEVKSNLTLCTSLSGDMVKHKKSNISLFEQIPPYTYYMASLGVHNQNLASKCNDDSCHSELQPCPECIVKYNSYYSV